MRNIVQKQKWKNVFSLKHTGRKTLLVIRSKFEFEQRQRSRLFVDTPDYLHMLLEDGQRFLYN